MLYVPMGYLLPYVFEWFRARSWVRPVLACFVISFITENLQLIFRRGFYDMDDLLANTLGGLIGQMLFISVGYVVTHPDWRRELFSSRRWKKIAERGALYPFAHRIGLSRTTLMGTDEGDVYLFYVTKLGFRPRKQLTVEDSFGTDFLFEMGRTQLEIHCSNRPDRLPTQYLSIAARDLPAIRERLRRHKIETGPFEQDPPTGTAAPAGLQRPRRRDHHRALGGIMNSATPWREPALRRFEETLSTRPSCQKSVPLTPLAAAR